MKEDKEGSQTEKRLGSRERRRLYASGVADEAPKNDEKVSKKTKAESKEKGKESTKEKSKRSKEDRCSEEEPPKKTKRKKKDAD